MEHLGVFWHGKTGQAWDMLINGYMTTIRHTEDSVKVAEFAHKYPGWHSFAKDKRTQKAVDRAELLDRIEVSRETRQFRAK